MNENKLRELICLTGRELLEQGLVARTWGNVSGRLDSDSFLITPSGLDYTRTAESDIALVQLPSLKWEGIRKPSSEKGIHAAAYDTFPDVGFVIHTHQSCASALGLAGFESMDITAAERERLGGIAKASYGLPGTKILKNAVAGAMKTGAKTVLMVNHGAVVCGRDKADAMEKVTLLENICRRNLRHSGAENKQEHMPRADAVLSVVRLTHPNADIADTRAAVEWAGIGKPLTAQLDDMAQMLGKAVRCAPLDASAIVDELKSHDAVFVRNVGAFVTAADADDIEAVKLLVDKAAVCALHTSALGARVQLPALDVALVRFVYMKKYSKQRGKA